MDKVTINDLQNITQEAEDRATRTTLKLAANLGASEG
jgi:hypothetical protein